jgi:hypothetical protein
MLRRAGVFALSGLLLFLVSWPFWPPLVQLSGSSIAKASPQLTLPHWPNFSKKKHCTICFEKKASFSEQDELGKDC